MSEIKASVKVQVIVEVVRYGYDGTHSFDFVENQARREAIEEVRAALSKCSDMRVIVDGAVVAVTLTEGRR